MALDTGERVHVDRRGVVPMALPFEEAFALFNAVGEQRWVAGWDPRFVHPALPRAGEGVVFQTTGAGTGTATWVQTLSSDADDFVRAFGEAFEDNMAHRAEAIQRHIVEGVPLVAEE